MSKEENNNKSGSSGYKKSLYQWLILGVVAVTIYLTGMHVPLIMTMQKGMLYTGLLNAKAGDFETAEGPFLNDADFRFSMISHEGETLQLGDLKGKVIFINIWASWCPPCRAEMPTIESLYTELADRDDIRFIMLSVDQERDLATSYMENQGYSLPYHFPASSIPASINSPVLPTTYVISREGQIVFKRSGIANYSSPGFRNRLIELSGF